MQYYVQDKLTQWRLMGLLLLLHNEMVFFKGSVTETVKSGTTGWEWDGVSGMRRHTYHCHHIFNSLQTAG